MTGVDPHPLATARLAVYVAAGPAGGAATAGLVHGDRVVPLPAALAEVHGGDWHIRVPGAEQWLREPDRLELFLAIVGWQELLVPAVDSLDALAGGRVGVAGTSGGRGPAGATATAGAIPLAEVRLRPLVRQPQKIVAVGLNYATHAAEAGRETPQYPVLFGKFANTLTGPHDDVPIPHASHRIDYEGELAVLIGAPASRVSREDADAYIAGYAVANDVSARDYQFRTKEMLQGKTFDRFCPLGPWLTGPWPASALAPLRLTTTVNGEPRQSATLGEMIFDVPFLIEYLSAIMTLLPGDVVLTGTPSGIGAAMTPRRWLRHGDTVEIEIAGLGRIRNRFVGRAEAGA